MKLAFWSLYLYKILKPVTCFTIKRRVMTIMEALMYWKKRVKYQIKT